MVEWTYTEVEPWTIIPGRMGSFSIYVKDKKGKFILYAKKGELVKIESLDKLAGRGVQNVYISTKEKVEYEEYLERNLHEVLTNDSVPIEKRKDIFEGVTTKIIEEFFEKTTKKPLQQSDVARTRLVVKNTLAFMLDDSTLKSLSKMMGHDYNTYSHSTSVFWLSIILAKYCEPYIPKFDIGKRSVEDYLVDVGTAALLHDIGKSMIPHDILHNTGRLTKEEFYVMQYHSVNSIALLLESNVQKHIQRAILHHHEDYMGGGYPFGLSGEDIPFVSRIMRVTDVFEAITSVRSYKAARTPIEAVQIMSGINLPRFPSSGENADPRDQGMRNSFDAAILKQFIIMLKEKEII